MRRVRRPGAHLVTEAREPRSEDIASRERRYLIMMGFRIVCFVATVVLYAQAPAGTPRSPLPARS